MNISQHAKTRMQHRGIQEAVVDILAHYGTPVRKKGNALEYRLKRKEIVGAITDLQHTISTLKRAMNKAVLVDCDTGDIITVYHRHK